MGPCVRRDDHECAARAFSDVKQPSPAKVIRRMGGAQRYPSIVRRVRAMGFAALYPSYKKTRLRILAARRARSDAIGDALEIRGGRREGRVPSAPAIVRTKCTRVIARCAGTPGLPCAMVLRLIARSSRSRIPLASVADELAISRCPVGPRKSPSA